MCMPIYCPIQMYVLSDVHSCDIHVTYLRHPGETENRKPKSDGCVWVLPLTSLTAESSCYSDPLKINSTKVTKWLLLLTVILTVILTVFVTVLLTVILYLFWQVFCPCLADPGNVRACSTNIIVSDQLIRWLGPPLPEINTNLHLLLKTKQTHSYI